MASIGWVGLGKLGYVCALALANAGHIVTGYDLFDPSLPAYEAGTDVLDERKLTKALSVAQVVRASDVVFVAVQTPHAPAYGGETPAPDERRDFEYGYLLTAVREISREAEALGKDITLVIVSTVLPGTCNRLVRPVLSPRVKLLYNPYFIAMSTTLADFTDPEFVLVGADDPSDADELRDIYGKVHDGPAFVTTIETAELIKVAYNTYITQKITWANAMMELCEKTGADCDDLVDALSLATDRVISTAYMRGGMGDSGACHPRDLIAMSWLSERVGMSFDLWGVLAQAREAQTEWLADLAERWSEQSGLPIAILGTAYKPGVPLEHGSSALLLKYLLERRRPDRIGSHVASFDPYVAGGDSSTRIAPSQACVYVIGTKHPEFVDIQFPARSVVIDPHGYIPDQPGVTVIRVGRKS